MEYSSISRARSIKSGTRDKLFRARIPWDIVKWIEYFLQDRTFQVKIGDHITNKYNITCGVPQGAVLSPTLFSVFINDIPLNKKKHFSNSLLFSDDLLLIHTIRKLNKNVESKINQQVKKIGEWLFKWRLEMTPSKCKYVIFSNDKKRAKEEKLNIVLNEVNLDKSDSITFLGIVFDKYLSFGENVKKIQEKCCNRMKLIKILRQNRWHLSLSTKLSLYKSLIRSIYSE